MDLLEQAKAKACCADLYQSDLARHILGDTLHPGGLALTYQLAKLLELQPGDWVVDLASGRGTSAMAVSRVFKCIVVGVEFGRAAVAEAYTSARSSPGAAKSHHIQGDGERPPLRPRFFDAVFCECSMSLFLDKACAAREATALLRPGGRFGLSDVTVEPNSLPSELDGTLGQMLCLTDALNVDGYIQLLEESGLNLLHQIDVSVEGIKILDTMQAKLGALMAWQRLTGQQGLEPELMDRVPYLLTQLRSLITQGKLGYWLFVAEKPADTSPSHKH